MIQLNKSLALVGLRGSGKSTLAYHLGKILNGSVIEMDELLVKEKCMNIPDWVKDEGWESFRNAEAQLLKRVSRRKKPCIVSTGGGVITQEKSVKYLQKYFLTVYLHWSPAVLIERIAKDPNRPRLGNAKSAEEEVKMMYKERNPIYTMCGHTLKLKKGTSMDKTISKVLDIIYRSQL
jgi:shikimate kinase